MQKKSAKTKKGRVIIDTFFFFYFYYIANCTFCTIIIFCKLHNLNKYKNYFGKPVVIVIKSQTGYPLYAFSGNNVYWEVPDNLPKFTKLTVDGKQLYIHRVNFQIIDKDLLK